MEFHYRAIDERRQPAVYFDYASNPASFSDQSFSPRLEDRTMIVPNRNVGHMLQRELEKERIIQDIIAARIMRKRELEDEVRNELILERRIALCNAAEGCQLLPPELPLMEEPTLYNQFFSSHISNAQFSSNMPPRREEELFRPGCAHSDSFSGSMHKYEDWEHGLSESDADGSLLPEKWNKDLQLIGDNYHSGQQLHQPHHARSDNFSGWKRKYEPGRARSGDSSSGWKRKHDASTCCALCQQKMKNEHDFEKHLHGRKHLKMVMKMQGGERKAKDVPPKKGKVMQADDAGWLWCETCGVQASSETTMDLHKKGKKHLARENLVVRNGRRKKVATKGDYVSKK